MSFAARLLVAPFTAQERRTVGAVSTAHAFSHFYMLTLPPVFPLLHGELDLSYAALGSLLSVYAVVTGLMMVPMGMIVDRVGGRKVMILGLAINASSILLIGLVPYYFAMLGFVVMAGASNAVFHPADYAILSGRVGDGRIGRAFSVHLFAGYIGWMLAPPAVLVLTKLVNWRVGLMVLGGLGLVYAGILTLQRDNLCESDDRFERKATAARTKRSGRRKSIAPFMTPVIRALFYFYVIIALAGNGIKSFSVVALVDLHPISLTAANMALTGYLVAAAMGTLLGGWMADRVVRHELVTAATFLLSALFVMPLGSSGLPLPAVFLLMVAGGFFIAVAAPLRDVMVREAAPKGSTGTVFGIVTTGFSVGSAIAPVLLGSVVDRGHPSLVFWAVSGFTLIGVLILGGVRSVRAAAIRWT